MFSFVNSLRPGMNRLRAASRQAVRGLSTTAATRTAPRYAAASGVAVAAITAWTLYNAAPARMEGRMTIAGEYMTETERSFIMCKPDATARQLIAKIIARFEERGYKIVALKMITPSKQLAENHYEDLKGKPFYPDLVNYISGGVPVVCFVIEGRDAVRQGRVMVGSTNPTMAAPGSIRGDMSISIGRNIIHASDSFAAATKEIGMWFDESEISNYKTAAWDWIMSLN